MRRAAKEHAFKPPVLRRGAIPVEIRETDLELFGPATLDETWDSGEAVWDALAEVTNGCNDTPPSEVMQGWTDFEKLIAYDWAIRERLSRDGAAVSRRKRPTFTIEGS